jgi:TonB-linked SusC/RagA family outer membrane protein
MKRITSLLVCLLLFGFYAVYGQNIQIKGTVTSAEDGSGLPGVTVSVKGTTIGVLTDGSGKYSISVPANAENVDFNFMGMKSQSIPIAGQQVIDVVMEYDTYKLDEVVVTALGITREKKALGYAVQEVASDAIENSGNAHMLDALSGKVAGVNITRTSGTAGSASFVEIRGAGSITGSNRPLFVVDGMPINETGGYRGSNSVDGVDIGDRIGDLNAEDIESISVLKGGAASALYGLRASNGVVLITTKKGKSGKLVVSVHSSVSFEKVSQMPELQKEYVQGVNGNILHADAASGNKRFSWGPQKDLVSYTTDPAYVGGASAGSTSMENWINLWDSHGRMVLASDPLANGNPVTMYDTYGFFQTGTSFKNNISLSGGNEMATFYLSAGNTTQEGVIPNNVYNKNNFKLSSTLNVSKVFKLSSDISYNENHADRKQTGSNISGVMLGLVRTPPTFDNAYGYEFENGSQRTFRGGTGYDNPYWVANNINYKDRFNRVIANAKMDAVVTNWLTFTYKVGTDWYTSETTQYFAPNSNASPAGYYDKTQSFSQDIVSDIYANINKDFSDFNVKFLLGQEIYQRKSSDINGYANSLLMPDWENIRNTGTNKSIEYNYQKRTSSVFGELGLSYKSMIFANFTGRVDKSTTLPEGNNSFFYPSASLGFIFTELAGLKSQTLLTYGKVRASYARTGRDAAAYSTGATFGVPTPADGWVTYGLQYPYMGYAGFSMGNTLGSADLKPEELQAVEFGIDLKFLQNRLGLEVTYFKNTNKNLLLAVPIAASSGYSASYRNAGTMETTGLEILLNVSPVQTSSLEWDITFGFANPHSKVIELYGNISDVNLGGFVDPQIHAYVDRSYRTIWGSQFLKDPNGNIIIDPTTGYPTQATAYGPVADFEEDFKFTINNNISFKGLYMSFLFEWKKGGKMYNGTIAAMNYFGTSKETASRETATTVKKGVYGYENADGSVTYTDASGNNSATAVANTTEIALDQDYYFVGPGSNFGTGPTENFIEDSDWLRLRELTFGYTLPVAFTKKFFVQQLGIYFTGYNLFLQTPYKGVDPETSLMGTGNAQGIDYFNMPGVKSYTFGIKLTL